MVIVFNSSPLIFLAKLEFLENFIHSYKYDFYTTTSVVNEIRAKDDAVSNYILEAIEQKKLVVRATNLISLVVTLSDRLGSGEAEAIALGTELQANYVILDDFPARKAALKLGLNVKGTLAIINKLHQEGHISINSKDDLYEQLTKINFRVKRSLFDQIFI